MLHSFDSQKAAAFFFLTFASEDAATFGAAALAGGGKLSLAWAFWPCFLGIWLGDLGLYGVARWGTAKLGNFTWWHSLMAMRDQKVEHSFAKFGPFALGIARFVPGIRLPTYLAAGIFKMPFITFLSVTGLMAAIWTGLILSLSVWVWKQSIFQLPTQFVFLICLIGLGSLLLFRSAKGKAGYFRQRILQWEFWPSWIFYLPVVLHNLALMIRYRSLTLPATANPGIENGGLIGESKYRTQAQLCEHHPAHSARAFLLDESEQMRLKKLKQLLDEGALSFPFILKPDLGQRGTGVKLISSWAAAENYLKICPVPLLAQIYAAGPEEAGIFYYRFAGQQKGRILAITQKIFPSVTGNGSSTIGQLIECDPRARNILSVYQKRFSDRWNEVLSLGSTLRLVEAGNHAQGCIFQDGQHLYSEKLFDCIDAIAKSIPGFFIGRFDLRYESEAALRNRSEFQIVELNGAASEATSIYDCRKSLFEAYAMLFQQWNLVYAIGAANRKTTSRTGLLQILRGWKEFKRRQHYYPLAD